MNPRTAREASALLKTTKQCARKLKKADVIVAPPIGFLGLLSKASPRTSFCVQHVNAELEGAHTGETSLAQAISLGAAYVLVGHAERRAMGETNDDVAKKVEMVHEQKCTSIVCVGEAVRDVDGHYLEEISQQITSAFASENLKTKYIVIAYEPVWAIGSSKAMGAHEVHEMSVFIRKILFNRFGKPGLSIPILYGGAVDAQNVVDIFKKGEVDGVLLGRSSANSESLKALCDALK